MTTKRKYIRVKDTKHENVRRYLADKPNASVADVMSAFAVSQSYSNQLRDAKKIKFYIDAEVLRLEGVEG